LKMLLDNDNMCLYHIQTIARGPTKLASLFLG
jgi:hypothetical protein